MKQAVSIFLSILLLVSSSGIAYAQHFCGDFEMLSQITLGEKHLSCGMAMTTAPCGTEGPSEDHNCCDNEYTKINTDDNFAMSSFDFQLNPSFVAAFVNVFVLELPAEGDTTQPGFLAYHPPPLVKDIPVLYETFLI
jgi:hypothetical protein